MTFNEYQRGIAIKNNKKLWERYPDGFKAENSLHRKEGDI